MAGDIQVNAKRLPVAYLNTQINKEILYKFKVKCKERGLVLNNVIETFVIQYSKERYKLKETNILKWMNDSESTETLNCAVDKIAYNKFKDVVKDKEYFIRYVVTAFIEDFVENDLVIEFTNRIHKGS